MRLRHTGPFSSLAPLEPQCSRSCIPRRKKAAVSGFGISAEHRVREVRSKDKEAGLSSLACLFPCRSLLPGLPMGDARASSKKINLTKSNPSSKPSLAPDKIYLLDQASKAGPHPHSIPLPSLLPTTPLFSNPTEHISPHPPRLPPGMLFPPLSLFSTFRKPHQVTLSLSSLLCLSLFASPTRLGSVLQRSPGLKCPPGCSQNRC